MCAESKDGPGIRSRFLTWRRVGSIVGLLVLGIAVYSGYVAWFYEADPQDTFILGQSVLAADAPASIRVLVRNHVTGRPVEDARVWIGIESDRERHEMGRFRTDASGSVDGSFDVPALPPGKYTLLVATRSRVGRDSIRRPIELVWPCRLYLTTDKPVYQPGQTIHIRSMALHKATLKPYPAKEVAFEVEDPKGNKVFRGTTKASAYGIASADFVLADEVNLGRYRIRANSGGQNSEKVITVKRYVLPKFKVSVTTDKPYYLPAETVRGVVRSSYFFGKPVAGARVEVIGRTTADWTHYILRARGATDLNGAFAFSWELPRAFAGVPTARRDAWLEVSAKVADAAGHVQESTSHLRVSGSRIRIDVLPESGEPVPGVENMVYVVTSYPDGRPAACDVKVNGKPYRTDAAGVAVAKLTPPKGPWRVEVEAVDKSGALVRVRPTFEAGKQVTDFLLRTDKAVYSGGESVTATILSAAGRGTYFLDVVKEDQTTLTKSLDVTGGRGEVTVELPPWMFGTLRLNAYTVTPEGESLSDTRVILVHQARELRIEIDADKPVYRPGETAKVRFRVTDPSGTPTPAALGVCAVDEAVFHVTENRPGLLKQFFMVDEALMRPAYQIKLFASPDRLLNARPEDQKLAMAALSRAKTPKSPGLSLSDLKGTYLNERMVERLRDGLEEGRYDYWLKKSGDPRFENLKFLLKDKGDHTLRATTYPAKKAAAEAYRERYFECAGATAVILAIAAVVLFPIVVFLIHAWQLVRSLRLRGEEAFLVDAQQALGVLACTWRMLLLFPIISYVAGLVLAENLVRFTDDETFMLGVFVLNVVFAAVMVGLQLHVGSRLRRWKETRFHGVVALSFTTLFVIQYVVTRSIILMAVYDAGGVARIEGLYVGAASATITLLLFAGAGLSLNALAVKHSLQFPRGFRPLEFLTAIVILGILAGMLMPSLARAREEGRRASARSDLSQLEMAMTVYEEVNPPRPSKLQSEAEEPRIRKDFPETLLWRPEIITDDGGRAELSVPLADSITTWRMSVDAVSSGGALGGETRGIRVFQNFFVDLDLPVALTQNDEVEVPVTCYNYLKKSQRVTLEMRAGDGIELLGPSTVSVDLEPNEVRSAGFRLKANEVGTHELTVVARGKETQDAVQRRIRVNPDGTEVVRVESGRLADAVEHAFVLPPEAIRNSQSLLFKVYPTRFSEVIEGLEGIFRMPFGCFEQTSSCTYPNVLVLSYLKRAGKATPEIEVKANKFINAGYQRLLTFEVTGGGFDWYGGSPANIVLTAYGILEFTDMAEVYAIDPAVIERARKWLYSKQNANGGWTPKRTAYTWGGVSGERITTAYVAWALAESRSRDPETRRALEYLRAHSAEMEQAYETALAANALLAHDPQDAVGRRLVERLRSRFAVEKETAYLASRGMSVVYSRGESLNTETTALATLALLKANAHSEVVRKALEWLSRQKDRHGTWRSTQATILAMKALLEGTGRALGGNTRTTIEVALNGKPAGRIDVTPETSDVLQMVSLTESVDPGRNVVHITRKTPADLPYQLAWSYWVPWKQEAAAPKRPLEIEVRYDRTQLAVEDTLKCRVHVTNNTGAPVSMAIIDLGIPPGFVVDTEAFARMVRKGSIAKYDLTGNQCILYTRTLEPSKPLRFQYELKARYPIRVKAPSSRVYEYYNPENEARARPVELVAVEE